MTLNRPIFHYESWSRKQSTPCLTSAEISASGDKCFATQPMSMNRQKCHVLILGWGVNFSKQVNPQVQLTLKQHRFNCMGPPIQGIFFNGKLQYYTIQGWFNLWMRHQRYGGWPTGHLRIFDCIEVSIPNTQDVQGSTVLNPWIVRINCNLFPEKQREDFLLFMRSTLPWYKARHKQYKKNYRLIFLMNITINVLNKPSNI